MPKLEIDVSDEMIQVLARMGEKSGKSPTEALAALLDREIGVYVEDQKRFNDLIAEGDDSGPAIEWTEEVRELQRRHVEEEIRLWQKHEREFEAASGTQDPRKPQSQEAEAA
jgi:hypothetical protein